jgi:hypothetical protein
MHSRGQRQSRWRSGRGFLREGLIGRLFAGHSEGILARQGASFASL